MCEFESRLVAWIDGELDADVALEMERHVRICDLCSAKASEYREVSKAFAALCAAMPVQRNSSRLRWAAMSAAALAAAAAVVLWMLPKPVEQLPTVTPKVAPAPAIAFETQPQTLPAQAKTVARHRVHPPAEIPQARWASEPSIEIAIPGDAMFAPGAIPTGITFAADLSIGADGSPRALRVRPGIYVK